MAVKIVRQEKNIALLGAPTSAAALAAGHERAPAALRAAGLVARLTEAGFTVTDHGDCATRVFEVDEEHPRARNVKQVVATLEELRPKVEMAVKSGALPVVLGGDSSIVLATIAGARRYYRNVSLIFLDRDADLKEPATTSSGSVDGMVISHVLGRGAPELVRFWGEPPLVRAPDVALFGIGEPDEAERRFMDGSPLRRYEARDVVRLGGAAAAEQALERVHGRTHEFVLHVDLRVIAPEDFRAAKPVSDGGPAGTLPLRELREALAVFARQPTLAALEISSYNPALDADGEGAKKLIELLADILSPRLKPVEETGAAVQTESADSAAPAASSEEARPADTAPSAPAEDAEGRGESPSVADSAAGRATGEDVSIESPSESVENNSIESISDADSVGAETASVENPQPAVERESPGESATHSTPPDSEPSDTTRTVERETPDE
ncbi:MAG TPA: arginase family protein [Candidatus Acidoferrales bacterium]